MEKCSPPLPPSIPRPPPSPVRVTCGAACLAQSFIPRSDNLPAIACRCQAAFVQDAAQTRRAEPAARPPPAALAYTNVTSDASPRVETSGALHLRSVPGENKKAFGFGKCRPRLAGFVWLRSPRKSREALGAVTKRYDITHERERRGGGRREERGGEVLPEVQAD